MQRVENLTSRHLIPFSMLLLLIAILVLIDIEGINILHAQNIYKDRSQEDSEAVRNERADKKYIGTLRIDISNYANLNAAVSDLGKRSSSIIISKTTELSGNLIIPSNIFIEVTDSGSIALGNHNLNIAGRFSAPAITCFTWTTGKVIFEKQSISDINALWFGLKINDSTFDNAVAINKAIASAYSFYTVAPITVHIPLGTFYVNSAINVTDSIVIMGAGAGNGAVSENGNGTILAAKSGFQGAVFKTVGKVTGNTYTHHATIKNLRINGNAESKCIGIKVLQAAELFSIENVAIDSCGFGIYIGDESLNPSSQVTFNITRVSIFNSTSAALFVVNGNGLLNINNISGDQNKYFFWFKDCLSSFSCYIAGSKMEVYDDTGVIMEPGILFDNCEGMRFTFTGGYVGARTLTGPSFRDSFIKITKTTATLDPVISLIGVVVSGYTHIINNISKSEKILTWDNYPQGSDATPAFIPISPLFYGGTSATLGGLKTRIVTVTSDYSVKGEDSFIDVDTTSKQAPITITLPNPIGYQAHVVTIRNKKDSPHPVRINVEGNPLYWSIGNFGRKEYTLMGQSSSITFTSDSQIWQSIENKNYSRQIPKIGTWFQGDLVYNLNPVPGGHIGWVCVTQGTQGTLSAKGSISKNSNKITILDLKSLRAGEYIIISGVSGAKRVLNIKGTTVVIDSNANATVNESQIEYVNAKFNPFGEISRQ